VQVAHVALSAGDQRVGQYVPGSRLQPAIGQCCADSLTSPGANGEVVLDHDRLAIEEKGGSRLARRVQQFVHQRDQALPEPGRRLVPLTIPMRVGDYEEIHRGVREEGAELSRRRRLL